MQQVYPNDNNTHGHIHRIHRFISLCACLFVSSLCSHLSAASVIPPNIPSIQSIQSPRDLAIHKGLQWLRSNVAADGSAHTGQYSGAMTSLYLLSHLSAGIHYQNQKHGSMLKRSLSYVLSQQRSDGYFGDKDKSRMYGHAICTFTLSESLGMIGDPELEHKVHRALIKALAITHAAAQITKVKPHTGGWHYQPNGTLSDLSVSGWQLISLHSAQQAGIAINADVFNAGIQYVRQLCNAEHGSVGYNDPKNNRVTLRGLGLLCLSLDKNPNDQQRVNRIAHSISKNPIQWKGPWFFYRSFFDAAGLSMSAPSVWKEYHITLETVLLQQQHKEGWWKTPPGDNEGKFGKIYCTSLALLALCVQRDILPAFQR